jgi:hypothetical protein
VTAHTVNHAPRSGEKYAMPDDMRTAGAYAHSALAIDTMHTHGAGQKGIST